jgi:hypothetical protein
VVSTPPGLTAKWLAPRLRQCASRDTRISSLLNNANFTTDGVHVAIRHMAELPGPDPATDVPLGYNGRMARCEHRAPKGGLFIFGRSGRQPTEPAHGSVGALRRGLRQSGAAVAAQAGEA